MNRKLVFDVDRVLLPSTEENPFANASLADLLKTFLESQDRIGLRQFAERAHMSRQRLAMLAGGAEATDAEIDAIQIVFADISARIDKLKQKHKTL